MQYAFKSRRLALLPMVAGVALFASACVHRLPEVEPVDIPRIRTELQADPANTELQVQLGMGLYKAGEYEQALVALQNAIDAGERSGAAYLYLGMTHEQLESWSGARDAYSAYLDVGRSDPLKNELRHRLQLVARNVLREQAQQALSQEAQLSGAAPTPRSLAVFPFGLNSDREDLEPLSYAISDMMITDFAVSNAITVLERSQIQTLLNEMALTEAGYAEPATGARAGRLLRAEHVVQGVITTLGQDNLRLDTDVLNISRAASAGTVSGENALESLFDLEKDLVFRTIRDVLGVQLTPAEEARIRDNRSDNILAFLAYGRGLMELDQGNYAAALAQFRQAQQLDPGFAAAGAAADETQGLSDAAATGTDDLGVTAAATGELGGGGAVSPPALGGPTGQPGTSTASTATTLAGASESVNPTPTSGTIDLGSVLSGDNSGIGLTESRQPVQESQGQESVTKTAKAQIRIVIQRPGGEQ